MQISNIDAGFENPSSNLKLVGSFSVELVYQSLNVKTVELNNSLLMRWNKAQGKGWN